MWKLKIELLKKQGLSKEQAMEKLLDEYSAKVKAMDLKLSMCMDVLSEKDFKRIFSQRLKLMKKWKIKLIFRFNDRVSKKRIFFI